MGSPFIAAILAGGKGERFWPLSRSQRPKQFLCLDGSGKSLLQATADRLLALSGGWEHLWVVTASHLADGVRSQLPDLPDANLLVEPEGRDTAPAVAWTALEAARRYGNDATLGFFPADHWIGDSDAFQATIQAAASLATDQEAIVTLGISPTYPSTGYGYIEQGESVGQIGPCEGYRVARFTEKPDQPTAEQFLASGKFSWNSGMFIFRAGVALAELQAYAPEIHDPLQAKGASAYAELSKISVDYALMEKTQKAYVIPTDFGWDDLGDWNALERLLKGDARNVELAQHVGMESEGCIFYNSDETELIATIGLEDVVVVRDRNITLIVPKARSQEIKQLLKRLREHPTAEHWL